MSLESNTAEFWDAVVANIEWEGLELNNGHQLRVIIPCTDGKAYTFDYWPKRRKITCVGSNRYDNVKVNQLDKWLKDYIKNRLNTVPLYTLSRTNSKNIKTESA